MASDASHNNGWRAPMLAIISGAFWAASFPPLRTGFLAYFFLVFLWAALEDVKSGWRAFRMGYIWGFIASAGTLWWIFKPTLPGMILLVLFLPVYAALYAWIHYRVARTSPNVAVLLAPVFFVAIEYIRSYGQFGFPWMNIAYSQTSYTVLVQFADIVGSFGISFWIVTINCCIYFMPMRPPSRAFWIAAGILLILFGAPLAYGIRKINTDIEGEPVRVALLQGNVDPYKKWTYRFKTQNARLYWEMIHSIEGEADLIIMPETATTCYHRTDPEMFAPIVDAVMDVGVPTLTGTLDFDDNSRSRYFNAAILIMPDGTYEQWYAKVQLVPFSEYFPFQDVFPSLHKLNFGGSHFTHGDKYTIFDTGTHKFSVLVCYESIFGWLSREFRNGGAQFLVNIRNDGWFGNSPGPYQHAMFNILRAIENRMWVARCANTGISMFIDAHGRIVQRTPIFEKNVLVGEIRATNMRTIYDAIGDVIGWGALIAAPFLLAIYGKVGFFHRGARKEQKNSM